MIAGSNGVGEPSKPQADETDAEAGEDRVPDSRPLLLRMAHDNSLRYRH
jgi:hypothetical protein